MTTTNGAKQRFTFGYHLNTWDLAGQDLEPALEFLAGCGFKWFEALTGDSLSTDFDLRHLTLGNLPPPKLVTDTDLLRRFALFSRAQRELGIRVASLYATGAFINPLRWDAEREMLETLVRILKGFDSPILVLGGGPPEDPQRPHEAEDYKRFAAALAEIGRYTRELDMWTVYHPHLDTFVERGDQLDRVMEFLDTDVVGLCIDPAHFVHWGSDPVALTRTYASAIRYMHYKDTRVDPNFHGVERYDAFCELGAGDVDLVGLTQVLLDVEYDGLAIIELDGTDKPPEDTVRESVAYLEDTLGLSLTPGRARE